MGVRIGKNCLYFESLPACGGPQHDSFTLAIHKTPDSLDHFFLIFV